jgi:hypothetical protein
MSPAINQRIVAEIEATEREIRDLREALDDASDNAQSTRLRYAIESRLHRLDELRQGRAL